MEKDKKVLIPLEEYESLVKDREALTEAREELKKDCQERKFYAEINLMWRSGVILPLSDLYEDSYTSRLKFASPRIRLMTKESLLEEARKEIDRLSELSRDLIEENKEKSETIERLRNRKLLDRILNRQ